MSTANAKAQQKNCPVERSATVLQRLVITDEFYGKRENTTAIEKLQYA
jgi:hypothetical protein